MPRERYIWDRQSHELVLVASDYESPTRNSKGRGLQVIKDIEPFQNVAIDGKPITSRRQKRDMMRAYGLEEIGNERPKPRKQLISDSDRQSRVAEAVKKSWYKLTGEY